MSADDTQEETLEAEEAPDIQEETLEAEEAPDIQEEDPRPKVKESGLMTAQTLKALQKHIGAKRSGRFDAGTLEGIGKMIGLGVPFSIKTRRHVRLLQRHLGLNGPQVTGVWYRAIKKSYDPVTTTALQRYLNEAE